MKLGCDTFRDSTVSPRTVTVNRNKTVKHRGKQTTGKMKWKSKSTQIRKRDWRDGPLNTRACMRLTI